MNYFLVPLMFLLGFALIVGTFFVVKQQSAALVERFGKFTSTRQSGLQLKIPMVDKIAGRLSLKIQQLDVVVETKTKDDVFVKLKVSVQYKVVQEKVYDAARVGRVPRISRQPKGSTLCYLQRARAN